MRQTVHTWIGVVFITLLGFGASMAIWNVANETNTGLASAFDVTTLIQAENQ